MAMIFNPLGNTVFIILRGYVKHETCSYPNRRARMETDASPSHSYLWDLQTTARQSVHVEKGVPGCYGKVCHLGLSEMGVFKLIEYPFSAVVDTCFIAMDVF